MLGDLNCRLRGGGGGGGGGDKWTVPLFLRMGEGRVSRKEVGLKGTFFSLFCSGNNVCLFSIVG